MNLCSSSLILVSVLGACNPQSTSKRSGVSAPATATTVTGTESGGKDVVTFSASATTTQVVTPTATPALAGTSVSFPPGAIAIDTEVTVQQGATLATANAASQLGVAGGTVTSGSPAVIVQPSTPTTLAQPMTISLQVSGATLLGAAVDPTLLAIIYEVQKDPGSSALTLGILPASALTVTGNSVAFQIAYFGVYQAVILTAPAAANEVATTTAITPIAGTPATPSPPANPPSPPPAPPPAPAPPGAFKITAPITLGKATKPDITWTAAARAATYDITIATAVGCPAPATPRTGITGTTLTPAALGDGDYFVCIKAINAGGSTAATNDSYKFTIKTTKPGTFEVAAPTSPSNVNTPTISWGTASSATSYSVLVGTGSGCSPVTQTYLNVAGTSQALTTLSDGTYFVCLTAVDGAGNAIAASNQPSFVVKAKAPAFTSLSAIPGPGLGQITVSYGLPANASALDYSRYSIVRQPGATPPANCASGTTVIAATANFPPTAGVHQITDTTAQPGETFSYTACIGDLVGNGSQATLQGIASVPYRIFVTSGMFNGGFASGAATGFAVADGFCGGAAAAAGLGGTWRALLSQEVGLDPGNSASASLRLRISGPVYNMAGALVASSAAALWSGTLAAAPDFSEQGTSVGAVSVWTGTTATGSAVTAGSADCMDWAVPSGSDNGEYGTASATDQTWLHTATQTCNQQSHLYCVSQTPVNGPSIFTAVTSSTDEAVNLTLHLPPDPSQIDHVVFRHLAGNFAPALDCATDGTPSAPIAGPFNSNQVLTQIDTNIPYGRTNYRACLYDANGLLLYDDALVGTPLASPASPESPVSIGTPIQRHVKSGGVYREIFITNSGQSGGAWIGLAGMNSECQTEGDSYLAVDQQWQAVASDTTTDAFTNVTFSGSTAFPIYNMGGLLVAANQAALFASATTPLVNSPNWLVNGFELQTPGTLVWTGSNPDGTKSGNNCSDWNSSGTGDAGEPFSGTASADVHGGWLFSSNQTCATSFYLLCLSN